MEDETNVFHKNNYTWNLEANMVYLESPAGVGFSVCNDTKECKFNDYSSADDNIIALRNFFKKFPEFSLHDLYLSGESYAGIYVPYLSWHVYNWNISPDNTFKFNLKGFMVGNAVTNWDWDGDASYVKMSYYYNLYP
jgi:carboxypeptidase C (cathepsin A)